MIGKIKLGKSFGGCIRYNLEREQAEILFAEGIRTESIPQMIDDFNRQRKMNPTLGKAVGHVVLSWSSHDLAKLSNDIMLSRAQEYLEKMKLTDTQYLVVRHEDRAHPHVHIIYNRVNYQAQTISDQYQFKRNVEVCRKMTERHGYYLGKGKEQVKRSRLTGRDKVKYEIYDEIKKQLKTVRNWEELRQGLKQAHIQIEFKMKGSSHEIQGISFIKGKLKFKGSEVDRSLSYARLNQKLILNSKSVDVLMERAKLKQQDSGTVNQDQNTPSQSKNIDLLDTLFKPEFEPHQQSDFEAWKRKQKKKKGRSL